MRPCVAQGVVGLRLGLTMPVTAATPVAVLMRMRPAPPPPAAEPEAPSLPLMIAPALPSSTDRRFER
jgi:hypothetical protein